MTLLCKSEVAAEFDEETFEMSNQRVFKSGLRILGSFSEMNSPDTVGRISAKVYLGAGVAVVLVARARSAKKDADEMFHGVVIRRRRKRWALSAVPSGSVRRMV